MSPQEVHDRSLSANGDVEEHRSSASSCLQETQALCVLRRVQPAWMLPSSVLTDPSVPSSYFFIFGVALFWFCLFLAACCREGTAYTGKPVPSWFQPWSHNRGWTIRSPGRHLWPLGKTSRLPLKESVALSSTCLIRRDACPSNRGGGTRAGPWRAVGVTVMP